MARLRGVRSATQEGTLSRLRALLGAGGPHCGGGSLDRRRVLQTPTPILQDHSN